MMEFIITSKERVLDGYEISFEVKKSIELDGQIQFAVLNKTVKSNDNLYESIQDNDKIVSYIKTIVDIEEITNTLNVMIDHLQNQNPIKLQNNN